MDPASPTSTALTLDSKPATTYFNNALVLANGKAYWSGYAGAGPITLSYASEKQPNSGAPLVASGCENGALGTNGTIVLWVNQCLTASSMVVYDPTQNPNVRTVPNYLPRFIDGIATDGKYAYYTQTSPPSYIGRAPLQSPPPVPTHLITTGIELADLITVVGGNAYYTDDATPATLWKLTLPDNAGTKELLYQQDPNGHSLTGLAANEKYAFFTDGGAAIYYVPVAGVGAAKPLVNGSPTGPIAIDSKALYYFDKSATGFTLKGVALPL